MQTLALLLSCVAAACASHAIHSFDECYREGDIVLDLYDRCKYRQCERVEPEHGYAHYELKDKTCAKGSGVPAFLLQQHKHGIFTQHRFIGSHLASTICSDKYVKDCKAYHAYPHYGYPHPLPIDPHSGYPPATRAVSEKKDQDKEDRH